MYIFILSYRACGNRIDWIYNNHSINLFFFARTYLASVLFKAVRFPPLAGMRCQPEMLTGSLTFLKF